MQNSLVTEDHRATHTKNTIPLTGLENLTEGAWISSNSGRNSIGFAQGGQSIRNLANGGYKLMCYTCKASDDLSLGHVAGPKNKRGTIK